MKKCSNYGLESKQLIILIAIFIIITASQAIAQIDFGLKWVINANEPPRLDQLDLTRIFQAPARHAVVDENGNTYILGEILGNQDTTIFGIDTIYAGIDSETLYLAKYDSVGNSLWVDTVGNNQFTIDTDIAHIQMAISSLGVVIYGRVNDFGENEIYNAFINYNFDGSFQSLVRAIHSGDALFLDSQGGLLVSGSPPVYNEPEGNNNGYFSFVIGDSTLKFVVDTVMNGDILYLYPYYPYFTNAIALGRLLPDGTMSWGHTIVGADFGDMGNLLVSSNGLVKSFGSIDSAVIVDDDLQNPIIKDSGNYILSIDSSGNIEGFTFANEDWPPRYAKRSILDSSGNIYTAGDFDGYPPPSPATEVAIGSFTLSNYDQEPFGGRSYLAKYNTATGSYTFAKNIVRDGGRVIFDGINGMDINSVGDIYICGTYSGDSVYINGEIIGTDSLIIDWRFYAASISGSIDTEDSSKWVVTVGEKSQCSTDTEKEGLWLMPISIHVIPGDDAILVLNDASSIDSPIPIENHCIEGFPNYSSYWYPIISRIGSYNSQEPRGQINILLSELQLDEKSLLNAKYIELWSPDLPNATNCNIPMNERIIVQLGLEENYSGLPSLGLVRTAIFTKNELEDFDFDRITQLYVLDEKENPIGKICFNYTRDDYLNGRTKEVLVFLHRNYASYQQNLQWEQNTDWVWPRKFRYKYPDQSNLVEYGCEITEDLYQSSMLIPPQDGNGNYKFENCELTNKPVLFVHGIWGTDPYWGNPTDYYLNSYTSRLRNYMDNTDIWEFYYPPDQPWQFSGFLLASDGIGSLVSLYEPDLSIVAHSMGGLVTRSALEGGARNYRNSTNQIELGIDYDPSGLNTYSGVIRENINRVIFLATPQHGSFSANRLYWEIYLPVIIHNAIFYDSESPAVRDLCIGSKAILNLNRRSEFFYNNEDPVQYYQLSGTDFRGMVPDNIPFVDPLVEFFGYKSSAIVKEASQHSDGIVSISSGSLLDKNESSNPVPVGLISGYNHWDFRDPYQSKHSLTEAEKTHVPLLISEFITSGTISESTFSKLYLWILDGIWPTISETYDGSIQVGVSSESPTDARLDRGIPIVIFQNSNGDDWYPRDWSNTFLSKHGFRFELVVEDDDRDIDGYPHTITLVHEHIDNSEDHNKTGMYLYHAYNNYSSDDFKEIDDNDNPAFYGYQVPGFQYQNPLQDFGEGSALRRGVGWHIPDLQHMELNVKLGFYIFESDNKHGIASGVEKRYVTYYSAPENSKIDLKWCTTTYNTIPLSDHAQRCLESVQSVNDNYATIQCEDGCGTGKINSSLEIIDSMRVWVDNLTNTITFMLEYGENSEPKMELVNPSGGTISPTDSDNISVYYTNDANLGVKYFTIINPESGKWETWVDDLNILSDTTLSLNYLMDCEAILSLVDEEIEDDCSQNKYKFFLDQSGLNTTNLNLLVNLINMAGISSTLDFNDNGISPDETASDGIFTGVFEVSCDSGSAYSLIGTMTGEIDGELFIRQVATSILSDTSLSILVNVNGNSDKDDVLPEGFRLKQNYPNPFNPSTTIEYSLPTKSNVEINIYNVLGRKVITLFDGSKSAGTYSVTWNGTDGKGNSVASGMYFYRIQAGEYIKSKKMMFLK